MLGKPATYMTVYVRCTGKSGRAPHINVLGNPDNTWEPAVKYCDDIVAPQTYNTEDI